MAEERDDLNPGGLTRDELRALIIHETNMSSQLGEVRGEYGKKVTALEKKGLVTKVWKAFRSITRGKSVASMQAAMRQINLYAELAGVNDQKDMDDFLRDQMPDTRTQTEKQMDGEVDALPKDKNGATVEPVNVGGKPMSRKDDKALIKFRKALAEAEEPDAVNKGLESFVTDHPHLEEYAIDLATKRLQGLGQPQEQQQPEMVH